MADQQVFQLQSGCLSLHASLKVPTLWQHLCAGSPLNALDERDDGGGTGASEGGSSEDARPITSATLTFVDLAGSERVSTAALEDSNQRARLLEVSGARCRQQSTCNLEHDNCI